MHHFLNDGYSWSLYPLLPLIAAEFGLSYGGSGAIKMVFNALLSATSIPFGILAERVGELLVLTLGTTAFALGISLLALAPSYPILLGTAFLAGAGGGASHPVGSSLVSRTAPGEKMNSYIAILNVAGDVGKAVLPALAGLFALLFGWRAALMILGLPGVALALGLSRWGSRRQQTRGDASPEGPPGERSAGHRRETAASGSSPGWGVRNWVQFGSLNAVGILDSLARSGVIVFAAFLLADKGFSTGVIGGLLSLTAVGGAFGKFFCGPLGDRFGGRAAVISTEILTVAFIVLFVVSRGYWIPPILFLLGSFLNGTSSVLYAMVPRMTTEQGRSRGFGIYYTTTLATSGLAPLLVGLLGDVIGLYPTYYIVAGVLLLTIPLTYLAIPREEDGDGVWA